MIRNANECQKEYREHMRGGDGTVEFTHLATSAELNEKGRLFSKITLKPGCGIGYHDHENESELFCVIKGDAEYNDNGVIREIHTGDVTICPSGTGHSITNRTNEDVELIAVILHA